MTPTAAVPKLYTQCCVAGGGPAGMMAAYLLARAGVEVVALEKHADFFRDFRGDTIHPSTLEIVYELGLLDEFLKLPHQEVRQLGGQIGDACVQLVDFTHLPTVCKFLALMPQWDFLDFIARQARRYPNFSLRMETVAHDLVFEGDRVAGVAASSKAGPIEIHAPLVIAADGRGSVLREKAGLRVLDIGAPIDVLWLRISRRPDDPPETLGRVNQGKIFIMINREDYWQCGFVIPKGGLDDVQSAGLERFRESIASLAPFLGERLSEIASWDDVKLLTVKVDRLERWFRDGFICIGDAAHAMSPVGGVGINLAVQDAVAAANALAVPLRESLTPRSALEAIQRRRTLPTVVTQGAQVFIQNRILRRVLRATGRAASPPWIVRLLDRCAPLRRIPAFLIGVGIRPEHVQSPATTPSTAAG